MEQLTEHSNEVSTLVQQNRSWLTRLIASRCDDASAAEDVLQEVSLAVVQSDDKPDSESRLRSWLCTIALRQCALRIRRVVRQRRLLGNVADHQRTQDDSSCDPLLWMMRSEHAELIRTALADLDPSSRWILLQKYQKKRTYAEIAEEKDMAAHKIEYQVLKARQTLHQKLIQLGIDQEVLL
ncbi:MAG: sigma-70 family RNA polymerase sigma factor [Fuerstiella sp.]